MKKQNTTTAIRLNATQEAAFDQIGRANLTIKEANKVKKNAMAEVKDVIDANRELFLKGITIGKYHFSAIERIELTVVAV